MRFDIPSIGALALALLLAGTLAAYAARADGGLPDPIESFGETRLAVSPVNSQVTGVNQLVYVATLVDNQGLPVSGFPADRVELEFEDCFEPSTRPSDQITPDGDSNQDGDMFWRLQIEFGGGDPCAVRVLVDGATFWVIESSASGGGIRSPDQNGDGRIDLVDFAQFQMAFRNGGPPFRGDFAEPLDDFVHLDDLAVFQAHFVVP